MAPLSDPNFDAGTMLAVKGDIEQLKSDITAFPRGRSCESELKFSGRSCWIKTGHCRNSKSTG